jgi:hypothetical protein
MKNMEKELNAAVKGEAELKARLNVLRVNFVEKKQEAEAATLERDIALRRIEAEKKDKLTAQRERDEALQKLEDENSQKLAAQKESDDAIRRLECFLCCEHENSLHAFIPCGHMVCSTCREKYTVPCPKCSVKIMGRLPLFN